MSERQFSHNRYPAYISVALAGTVALSHAMSGGAEARQLDGCRAIDQASYESVDELLSQPLENVLEPITSAHTYYEVFDDALRQAEATQASSTERFTLLQSLAKQYYDIDVTLRTEAVSIPDVNHLNPPSPAMALAVDPASLTDNELSSMYHKIAQTPRELFEAAGAKTIVTYRGRVDSNGFAAAGYFYTDSEIINLAVGYRAIGHELYHMQERRPQVCGRSVNSDMAYARLADPEQTGASTTDLQAFIDKHHDEITSAKVPGVADGRQPTNSQAVEYIASLHPVEAATVTEATDYGRLTLAESKAEIIEPWLMASSVPVNTLLSPHFPRLRQRSRLLLARLHATLPGVVAYYIEKAKRNGLYQLDAGNDPMTSPTNAPGSPPQRSSFIDTLGKPIRRPRQYS
jgi:hypothetical protein